MEYVSLNNTPTFQSTESIGMKVVREQKKVKYLDKVRDNINRSLRNMLFTLTHLCEMCTCFKAITIDIACYCKLSI